MKNKFNIDIVITWVDGSDKEWIKEKNKYLPKEKQTDIDAAANRFRDWDNVKYIFRGIEKFAPWVHKVFFVTCGQTPKWMNTKNDRLVLVNHKDYMPAEYLPTFSSHPIELNMHRIKGLSEHFIYMNDDFFFTKPVKSSDLFDKNGLPKLIALERPLVAEDEIFYQILHNNLNSINSLFPKTKTKKKFKNKFFKASIPGSYFCNKFFNCFGKDIWLGFQIEHLPAPFLKSSIESCWKDFYNKLDETSKNKFRSICDVNQYLFTEYQLCTGKFSPDRYKRKGELFNIDDGNDENIDKLCKAIEKQKYKMICLNDSNIEHFEETRDKVNAALDSILPEKSSFEL